MRPAVRWREAASRSGGKDSMPIEMARYVEPQMR